jgi:hypothetical protein
MWVEYVERIEAEMKSVTVSFGICHRKNQFGGLGVNGWIVQKCTRVLQKYIVQVSEIYASHGGEHEDDKTPFVA